jgi:hypothetical protein
VREREGAALCMFYIHKEPRFRSEKSAADTKLEKTSLSAGGFLRVLYGYRTCKGLRCWRALGKAVFIRGGGKLAGISGGKWIFWGGKGGDMVFRMIVDKFGGEEAGFRGICGECV